MSKKRKWEIIIIIRQRCNSIPVPTHTHNSNTQFSLLIDFGEDSRQWSEATVTEHIQNRIDRQFSTVPVQNNIEEKIQSNEPEYKNRNKTK